MNLIAMLKNHPGWGALTLSVLVWYSSITIYVAIRGALDIKHMFQRLRQRRSEEEGEKRPSKP